MSRVRSPSPAPVPRSLDQPARAPSRDTIFSRMPATTIVGIISDTHGLLRPEALEALDGSDLILHAGDIGTSSGMEARAEVAPLVAVRGNVDRGEWAKSLPEKMAVEISGATIYILHDRQMLDLKPESAGFQAVISGH